jgi:integrase
LPLASPAFRPITRHGRLGTPSEPDLHARLTGQSVALLVKQAVALLDDPNRFPAGQYAGHSLRAGFATQAASSGVPLDRIMRQTRHTSIAIALRYIREADIWKDNASAALGL